MSGEFWAVLVLSIFVLIIIFAFVMGEKGDLKRARDKEKFKAEFRNRDWTQEDIGLELKKINRELERRSKMYENTEDNDSAFVEVLENISDTNQYNILKFTTEELHQFKDILELKLEKPKQKQLDLISKAIEELKQETYNQIKFEGAVERLCNEYPEAKEYIMRRADDIRLRHLEKSR